MLKKAILAGLLLQGINLTAGELSEPVVLPNTGNKELRSVAVSDHNGDKLPDLVMGNYGGAVIVSYNSGTAAKPAFLKEQSLKSGGKAIKITHW
jgi:hypothetical protein